MPEYRILDHKDLWKFDTKTEQWKPVQRTFVVATPDGNRWEVPVELEEGEAPDPNMEIQRGLPKIERTLSEILRKGSPL